MNKAQQRIDWIDIAKGLMIIGMVLNHIPNYCNRMGVDISSFPWTFLFGHAYGVFTMQSFFMLSGYTSNFNEEPRIFLKKQLKGLIVPYIAFTLICGFLDHTIWGTPYVTEVSGERYSFLIESYWFLTALFIAKVSVYFLRRLSKNHLVEWGGYFCCC